LITLKNPEVKFMSSLLPRIALVALLSAVAAVPPSRRPRIPLPVGFGGGDSSSSTISTTTVKKTDSWKLHRALLKYAATLRFNRLVDQRKVNNPRLLV